MLVPKNPKVEAFWKTVGGPYEGVVSFEFDGTASTAANIVTGAGGPATGTVPGAEDNDLVIPVDWESFKHWPKTFLKNHQVAFVSSIEMFGTKLRWSADYKYIIYRDNVGHKVNVGSSINSQDRVKYTVRFNTKTRKGALIN